MKKIIIITFIFFTCYSCKAQIAPLYHLDPHLPEGTYYKDLDNDLNKFEGTWRWQSNDSIITIELQKKEEVFNDYRNRYEDYIVGEYSFRVNGVVVQNYLARLDDPNIIGLDHYIGGNRIMDNNSPPLWCDDCSPNEKRLRVYFNDPDYDYIPSQMVLRHLIINSVEQLHITLKTIDVFVQPYENAPVENRIPFGEYVFIKQQKQKTLPAIGRVFLGYYLISLPSLSWKWYSR